ncbi:MAG TPA: prolipoprotein diacylglyceryl transferase family protein [Gemmatimonadaceae bacterium]|nr:prolipoprotein diacylglyceryl transferase family protein [Gemmatimonadaceae bacterium]
MITVFASPPPELRVRGHPVNAFHFYGIAGLLAAAALSGLLAGRLALSVGAMMASVACGIGTMIVLAHASQLLLGREVLVCYHHFAITSLVAAAVARMVGVPVVPHVAAFVLGFMMVHGIGRLGCFSVGCCHGRPSRWGVRYGAAHVEAGFGAYLAGVPLVPVQLFEAVVALSIGAVGASALLHGSRAEDVLLGTVTAYALLRLATEFQRGDPDRWRFGPLTETQWTSLLLLLATTVVAWATQARPRGAIGLVSVGASLAVAGWAWDGRRRPWRELLEPDHMLEVAGALAIVCGDAGVRPVSSMPDLHVATTSCGISLSSSELARDEDFERQYTMSRAFTALGEQEARRLAALVMQLRHPGKNGTVLRARRTDAFHLLVGRDAVGPGAAGAHP